MRVRVRVRVRFGLGLGLGLGVRVRVRVRVKIRDGNPGHRYPVVVRVRRWPTGRERRARGGGP